MPEAGDPHDARAAWALEERCDQRRVGLCQRHWQGLTFDAVSTLAGDDGAGPQITRAIQGGENGQDLV